MANKLTNTGIPSEGGLSCPMPILEYQNVLLAHGGGGRLTHQLIKKIFLSQFGNEWLEPLHDGAILPVHAGRIAFTTDSYVVQPLEFPGGDIGKLAVNGTVNDLAMCGAKPLFLSCGFVIEEGLSMDVLVRIVKSMQEAALSADVQVVTGDTKVVDRGKGDKLFINTSGIGVVPEGVRIAPTMAAVGDKIIINGPIALHGIAVLSVREGLQFETRVESDTVALNSLVDVMLETCRDIHVLRDPTRGGVATTLNEIAESANVGIEIDERAVPVPEEVRGACEIMGLDPLYVANEGKLLCVVPANHAEKVLRVMRSHPQGAESAILGQMVQDHPGTVVMTSRIGGSRVVDMLSGEQLPRIC